MLRIEQLYRCYHLMTWSQTDVPKHTPTQDRQCTYNVTLRRVPATTVAVEKQ